MKTLCVLAALMLAGLPLVGQGVVVAPHAVFIVHGVRSGSLFLYNPNTAPVEVSISTVFGYPVSDSTGRVTLQTIEQPDSGAPSAAAWVRAFPRRLTVPPLERQTVRLLATPPEGLADGEYWTRVVVSAKGGRVPISGVADTAAIRVGVTLEVRTLIALSYRKGAVRTGVTLSNVRAALVRDSLAVWARLQREGNAAFIGTVRLSLVDSTGAERVTFKSPVAVYYVLAPRLAAATGRLAPGRYWVRIEVSTDRDDVPRTAVLPAPPIRDSVEVRVP